MGLSVKEVKRISSQLSTDIGIVVLVIAATALAVLLDGPAIIRTPLAVSVVFFVPGYLFTVALFPVDEQASAATREDGISLLDRFVISVGLSVSAVILLALVFDFVAISLIAESVVGGLVAVSGVTMPVAWYRRQQVPAADRFAPHTTAESRGRPPGARSGRWDALRVLLALCVLFAGGAVAYSAGLGEENSAVTEFYFQGSENASGVVDYPTNFTDTESERVTLVIGNREGEQTTYAVVGQLQRAHRQNSTVDVRDRQRIYREDVTLAAGKRATLNTTVSTAETGQYRLVYLLYRGDVPDRPRTNNADREIHLWINVTDSTAGSEG
jgi:uncharacterized membrane protein